MAAPEPASSLLYFVNNCGKYADRGRSQLIFSTAIKQKVQSALRQRLRQMVILELRRVHVVVWMCVRAVTNEITYRSRQAGACSPTVQLHELE